MDASLAALLGAAVGALGTATAAGVTGYFARSQVKLQLATQERQAERQIRADHTAQLREPRRQAYAAYAAEISTQLDALWWVADFMSGDASSPDAALARLRDSFEASTSTAYERVLLEGPEDVAYAAARLGAATQGAAHIAFGWFAEGENVTSSARGPAPVAELRAAIDQAKRVRRDYRMLVMEAVRAHGSEPESDQARSRAATIIDRLSGDPDQ